ELKAGLNGNFSSRLSFMAMVKYTTVDSMLLYYNDLKNFNTFNALYDNGKVLNLHAELTYHVGDKFSAGLRFDQYGYKMDVSEEAWHKPNTELALDAKYNLWEKFILNASIYSAGKYFVRLHNNVGYYSEKVNGYIDLNIGIEYRYSKVLSIYANLNN